MKQVLLSSVLVGLLSVSAIGATLDPTTNNVVFSNTNTNADGNASDEQKQANVLDLSSSNGVYKATSSENTIALSKDVQYANIEGGVLAEDTKKIIFDFQGAPQGKSQILNFGSTSNNNSKMIQTQSGGEIVFDFAGGKIGQSKTYLFYSTINYSGNSTQISEAIIKNAGTMTFDLGDYASLSITGGRREIDSSNKEVVLNIVNHSSNTKGMIFNIGRQSSIDFNGLYGDVINEAGKLEFKISSAGGLEDPIDAGKETKIITKSGATTEVNFLKSFKWDNPSFIGVDIQNESDGKTEINFSESRVYLYGVNLTNQGNKDDVVLNFQKASSVSLGNGTFQNVTLNFESEGNVAFSSGFLTNLTWIDNPQSYSNTITLSSYTEFVQRMDYTVYRNEFAVLEIGTKGDNVGKTGISGNNLTFVVYANLGAKAHLYAKDENGRDDYPLYENNIPVIDESKKPTIGGQELGDTYAYSDRVIIHSSQGNQGGVHNIGVVFSYWDYANLSSLSYKGGDVKTEGNIAIASVAKDSKVELNPTSVTIGFNSVETSFEKVFTDDQGIIDSNPNNNTYTTYFLKSAQDVGVAPITQEVTSSVFALNYDLFIANFNSLNKRMGNLRNNPYSQGAWGRIFNGQLSNDFGLGSSNNYTTLQAGYDYDFALTNAKNYLGVAFAYGFSNSEMSSNASNALQSREIKDIFSNNIELALYNAYVEDSGLYSDSIAKFSYLLSNFNLTNNGASESLSVNNYAFQLSEEVGYVFTLGESKEWSITPQAELSFGYYSDSDLTQVAGDFYLDAKAKSMLMLRARVGAMVGYDFKQYTQDKDISTTLYAGLSYEYDYLSGGDIELTPNMGKATTTKSALSSDGRGVLNLGTNITLKDDIRLYADFQTSFGGKINTDYQINIGARFSFGERGESRVEENKQI